jgi:alpha-beta hydrolase superfamily lysophospholipase
MQKRLLVLVLVAALVSCSTTGPATPYLLTSDGVHIAYTFHPGNASQPTVLFLHMVGRDRHDFDQLATEVSGLGFSTLQIDFRGHGQSDGRYRLFTETDWQKLLLDVSAAQAFVNTQQPDSLLILVGASIGANVAADHAAQDKDVIGLAMLSPGLDYHSFKPEQAIKSLRIPVFLAVSKGDLASMNASQQFAGEATMDLHTYAGTAHGTQMLAGTNVSLAIERWMDSVR